MANAIHVTGLRELELAFLRADRARAGDLRDALMEAAAPVRSAAQALASAEIRNVHAGDPWAGMRIGIGRSIVYVAPVERGLKSRGDDRKRRPKFGTLLMNRAMEPALEENRVRVEDRLDRMLDEVADVWEAG